MEDQDFKWFIEQFRAKTSIDLSLYKSNQMKRRLTSLMHNRGFRLFREYYQALLKNAALMDELIDRITINVSEFWRNPDIWKLLQTRFIPELLQKSSNLKIWSAACSSGEEPYTLAMILDQMQLLSSATLLATDIDVNILKKAKLGVYPKQSVREVPAEYLQKYFQKQNESYVINNEMKQKVRFSQMDLLVDPFPSRLDLIVCRNVMIYFTDQAKQMLYHKFAQALRPGGILFVGSTEQIFQPEQYHFETADTFFYRRK